MRVGHPRPLNIHLTRIYHTQTILLSFLITSNHIIFGILLFLYFLLQKFSLPLLLLSPHDTHKPSEDVSHFIHCRNHACAISYTLVKLGNPYSIFSRHSTRPPKHYHLHQTLLYLSVYRPTRRTAEPYNVVELSSHTCRT